jgi:plastocyanin
MERLARTAITALAAAVVASCARPAPRVHTIAIRNFAFLPNEVTVARGDTIVWSNADFVPHSATARDGAWDSKAIEGSGSWRFVATRPGRHDYYCVFHPNMKGTVVVR